MQAWKQWEPVEGGVDYLTATTMNDSLTRRDQYDRQHSLAIELLSSEMKEGYENHNWSLESFKGFHCGRVSVGQSERGLLIRLSGSLAARRWKDVYENATGVSRIDVQATIRNNGEWLDMSRVHLDHIRAYQKKSAPRLRYQRIDGGKDGNSLLIGRRVSECFARIYDKGAESGEEYYRDAWRYEVEFKKRMAKRVAAQLAGESDHLTGAAGQALTWFDRRGCTPPAGFTVFPQSCGQSEAPRGDRALVWLATVVRGTVARLSDRGRLDEAIAALGLHDKVQIKAEGFE